MGSARGRARAAAMGASAGSAPPTPCTAACCWSASRRRPRCEVAPCAAACSVGGEGSAWVLLRTSCTHRCVVALFLWGNRDMWCRLAKWVAPSVNTIERQRGAGLGGGCSSQLLPDTPSPEASWVCTVYKQPEIWHIHAHSASPAALSLSDYAVEGEQASDLSQALSVVCRATPAVDQGRAAEACLQLQTWMGPGAAAAAQRGAAQCQRQAPPAVQPQMLLTQLQLGFTGQLGYGQGAGQSAPVAGMAVEVRCMPSKPCRCTRTCAQCVWHDEGAAAGEVCCR